MERKVYGYMRVSTKEQNEDRQKIAMQEYGVLKENLFLDKQSGKNFERPEYQRLMSLLKKGDIFVIKSIDRLGRNFDEIMEQWRFITREKQAGIIVLDVPILNTGLENDLLGKVIAELMLTLMSYMAETERSNIHQRQTEGIAAAKKRGVKFGKKPKEKPTDFEKTYMEWKDGSISARKAAKQLGITHPTFLKWTKTIVK